MGAPPESLSDSGEDILQDLGNLDLLNLTTEERDAVNLLGKADETDEELDAVIPEQQLPLAASECIPVAMMQDHLNPQPFRFDVPSFNQQKSSGAVK